jgi:hypothetical protein
MAGEEDKDKPPEQRRHERVPLPENFRATIKGEDGVEREVTVKDLSDGGAGLGVEGNFENDSFVELHMEGHGTIPGRVVRKFVEGIGVEFDFDDARVSKDKEEELRKFRLAVARKEF